MTLQNRGTLASTSNQPLGILTYGELLARLLQGTPNVITGTATAVGGLRNTLDGTAAAYTVTLPAPAFVGQPMLLERIDTTTGNTIAVQGATGATIEGSTTRVINHLAVGVAGESTLFIAESLTSWAIAGAHKPASWITAYIAQQIAVPTSPVATALSATYSTLQQVYSQPTVTLAAAGTLTAGAPNALDASSGSFTATLPAPSKVGQLVVLERVDSSSNVVTVAAAAGAAIRGSASATIAMPGVGAAYEGLSFIAESLSSWRPGPGHKPKGWLDKLYVGKNTLVFHISDFGALSNGGTDDTAAIQAAIDACYTAGGGIVRIPSGTTRGRARLRSKVTLQGTGPGSVLRLPNAANANVVELYDARQEQCVIRDLTIDGARYATSQTTGHGIYFANDANTNGPFASGANNPNHSVLNVRIQYVSQDGVFLNGDIFGGGCTFNTVSVYNTGRYGFQIQTPDNQYLNCTAGQTGDAAWLDNGSNAHFLNCTSFYAGQVTAANGNGWRISGSRNTYVGCQAQDNQSHGFAFTGANNTLVAAVADSNGTGISGGVGFFFNGSTAIANMVQGQAFDRGIGGGKTAIYQRYGAQFSGAPVGNRLDITHTMPAGYSGQPVLNNTIGNNTVTASVYSGSGNLPLVPGNIQTKSGNYTALSTDAIVLGTGGSPGITITLPPVALGQRLTVKKVDSGAGAVTVTPATGTVDGASNIAISSANAAVRLVSDGTNWFTI